MDGSIVGGITFLKGKYFPKRPIEPQHGDRYLWGWRGRRSENDGEERSVMPRSQEFEDVVVVHCGSSRSRRGWDPGD